MFWSQCWLEFKSFWTRTRLISRQLDRYWQIWIWLWWRQLDRHEEIHLCLGLTHYFALCWIKVRSKLKRSWSWKMCWRSRSNTTKLSIIHHTSTLLVKLQIQLLNSLIMAKLKSHTKSWQSCEDMFTDQTTKEFCPHCWLWQVYWQH